MGRKKLALALLLGLLGVWPAAQAVLVETFDFGPARFLGFADNATTATQQWVLLIELRGEQEIHLHNSWFSVETRGIYREYRKRRAALGKLAPPHRLAEAILAERPEINGLKIVVMRDQVSAKTSRTVARPGTAFLYRR
jgi:hypothetical protein